jgi:alkanesulfonate monooxygenase SsuD/methylene tetrahydromethanopterin reductase-like flavin-dependent oxidoreductase (luciferase family)
VTSHPFGATAVAGAEQAIPVVVAAMGPQALRITGEFADGTVPFLTGPKALEQHIIPVLTKAAAGAGRVGAENFICAVSGGMVVLVKDAAESISSSDGDVIQSV